MNLDDQQKFVNTKFDKFPMRFPIGVQQKLHSDYSPNILDTEDFPSLPPQNLMVNNVSVVLDRTKLLKLGSNKRDIKICLIFGKRVPSFVGTCIRLLNLNSFVNVFVTFLLIRNIIFL